MINNLKLSPKYQGVLIKRIKAEPLTNTLPPTHI